MLAEQARQELSDPLWPTLEKATEGRVPYIFIDSFLFELQQVNLYWLVKRQWTISNQSYLLLLGQVRKRGQGESIFMSFNEVS